MPEATPQSEPTEMLAPPHEPGKTADEIQTGMDAVSLAAGGIPHSPAMTWAGRTRVLFAHINPYWKKMAWWVMLFLSILVMALDLNAWTSGAIGEALMWAHSFIFRRFPSFAFMGGMMACYYVVFRGERGPRS